MLNPIQYSSYSSYRGGNSNAGEYEYKPNSSNLLMRSPSYDNGFSAGLSHRYSSSNSNARISSMVGGYSSPHSAVRALNLRSNDSNTLGRYPGAGTFSKPPLPTSSYDRAHATLNTGSNRYSSHVGSSDSRASSGRHSRASSMDRTTFTQDRLSNYEDRSSPANSTSSSSSYDRRPSSAVVLSRRQLNDHAYEPPSFLSQHRRAYAAASPASSSTSSSSYNFRSIPIRYESRASDESRTHDEERDVVPSLPSPISSSYSGFYRTSAAAMSVPDVPTYARDHARSNSHLPRQELEDDEEDDTGLDVERRNKFSQSNYRRGSDSINYSNGTASPFVKNEPNRSSSSSVESSESSRLSSGRSSNSEVSGASKYIDGRTTRDDDDGRTNGLTGLRNLGNTCFMNSVIQCLSQTRPLRDYCVESSSLLCADINNNTTSRMKGALIKAFGELLSDLWAPTKGGYVTPDRFKMQIQKFAPRFTGYNQQDAQEFLRYLLQGLHEDINRVQIRAQPLPPIDDQLADAQKAAESWKRYLRIDDSKIVDIFVGQLKSELKCTYCRHVSTTFDPFWDLSLPIPQDKRSRVTLYDCIDTFTKEEILDGDEKPTCEKCKVRRRCIKKFSIQKFPTILVLHLKRFSGERYRARLSTLVDFPLKSLDLSQYAAVKSAVVPTYDLYAVSNHSGTPLSGHYTAYCRHSQTGRWVLFDDTRVTSVNERSVISSEAYVLFYEMSSTSSSSRL